MLGSINKLTLKSSLPVKTSSLEKEDDVIIVTWALDAIKFEYVLKAQC